MSKENAKEHVEQVEEDVYDIQIDPRTGREQLVVRWASRELLIVQLVLLGIVDVMLCFSLNIQFQLPPANAETWAFLGVNVLGVLGLIVFGLGRTRISVDSQHLVIYRGPLALPPRKRRILLSEIVNVSADKRLNDGNQSKGYWIFLSCKNGRKIKLLSQHPSDESKDIIERFIAQQASKR